MDLQKLTQLLESIPHNAPTERERTFLEITEYPHLENVSSNVLEFFFDTDGEHGLGTLFLEALLDTAGQPYTPGDLEVDDTHREAPTQEKFRLDLIIETETLVIGIENKLFASLNNDFIAYEKHLREQAKDRKVVCILLSLYPTQPGPMLGGFIPITYSMFFENVRKHMGRYVVEANQRYVPFLFDFMQTIEHFLRQEESMADTEFREWVAEHQDDIQVFIKAISDFKSKLYTQVKDLRGRIDIEKHKSSGVAIAPWIWQPPDLSVKRVLVYDFVLPNQMKVTLEIILNASSWRIISGRREPTTMEQLSAFLEQSGLKDRPKASDWNYQIGELMPFNTEKSELARKMQDFLDRMVAAAQSLPKEGNA